MTTIDEAERELREAEALLEKARELEAMLAQGAGDEPEPGRTTRKDTIDITVVLDRSGSMADIAADMRGGFDSFVAEQRRVPGDARLTLIRFDTEYEFVHRGVPLDEVAPLALRPRGSTALLDAIGRAIGEAMDRVERDRPEQVVFMIITDGMENASREMTRDQIMTLIEQCRRLDWQFVFLGADESQIAEARRVGFDAGMALRYGKNGAAVGRVMAMCSHKMARYRSEKASSVLHFTPEEREAARK